MSPQHTHIKTTPEVRPASEAAILKVAKEVVIKFIEVGRLSPGNFPETFDDIYKAIKNTVQKTLPNQHTS